MYRHFRGQPEHCICINVTHSMAFTVQGGSCPCEFPS